jgi:hypothetical protein
MNNSLCRIGVFYDGSFFAYAQRHFYSRRKLGWLMHTPFHVLVESHIREKEPGYANYRVVYAAWFQALFTATKSTDQWGRAPKPFLSRINGGGKHLLEPETLVVS